MGSDGVVFLLCFFKLFRYFSNGIVQGAAPKIFATGEFTGGETVATARAGETMA
jgi:hypothetical protein